MLLFAIAMGFAIACSIAGDFLVKRGADRLRIPHPKFYGGLRGLLNPGKLIWFVRQSNLCRNSNLIWGVVLLALHFGAYILALRLAAVTLVVPLMSSTYIAATLLGRFVFHEPVSRLRWAGVGVIILGVILLGFSD